MGLIWDLKFNACQTADPNGGIVGHITYIFLLSHLFWNVSKIFFQTVFLGSQKQMIFLVSVCFLML